MSLSSLEVDFADSHNFQLDMFHKQHVCQSVSSATTLLCSAASCAVTVDHLQGALWDSGFIGQNWHKVIVLQFSSPITWIHVLLYFSPHPDLVIDSLAATCSRRIWARFSAWRIRALGNAHCARASATNSKTESLPKRNRRQRRGLTIYYTI